MYRVYLCFLLNDVIEIWGMMILMNVKGYVMFIYICFFWDDVMEFV